MSQETDTGLDETKVEEFYRATKPEVCPECGHDIITLVEVGRTMLAIPVLRDSNGKFHAHDPNTHVVTWRCGNPSERHEFRVRTVRPCSVEGCDWSPDNRTEKWLEPPENDAAPSGR